MISYDRLWKTLIDMHLTKTEMMNRIGITSATLAKMGRNEPVHLKYIQKICTELNVNLDQVLEITP